MPDCSDIQRLPLPYAHNLEIRALDAVSLVVMHCTELPDLATAREFGERIHYTESQTGNSGHFYIDLDGSVHQWVPLDRVAHHTRNFNAQSIGIELVNIGRYPNWLHSRHQTMAAAYTPAQLSALEGLLGFLTVRVPSLRHIAGHEDLDLTRVPAEDDPDIEVQRKLDPGPHFPWQQVLDKTRLTRLESARPL